MNRTILLLAALATLPCFACSLGENAAEQQSTGSKRAVQSVPAPERARNVLLITLDTTRADALTPYGQARVTSPQIDRLARQGVVFEQAASAAPSTLPSHTSILTGRYPYAHKVRANAGYALSQQQETIVEAFKAAGYQTGAEIAAPVLNRLVGLDQGFDSYRDLDSEEVATIDTSVAERGKSERALSLHERPADDITHWGKRFLDRHRASPFLLWLHYFDPHRAYVQRPEFTRRLPGDPYLAEVLFTDAQVGALIDHLEELGLRESTLVVLVADHGEGLGEHGESNHDSFVYETTIRVPLIFWGPESLTAGLRVPSLVRTVDIAATLLDFAGLPPDPGMQGVSLLPVATGTGGVPERPAYGESTGLASIFGGTPLRYLRSGSWKYIHQVEPELYNLGDDPHERVNLAKARPDKVQELQAQLKGLIADSLDGANSSSLPLDPERAAQLRALGYVDSGAARAGLSSLELSGRSPHEYIADSEQLSKASGFEHIGDYARAEAIFREVAGRYPESPTILRDHGRSLSSLNRLDEARSAFERALSANECSATNRMELAETLAKLGDRRAQLEVLRKGVDHCSESTELLNNYAYLRATDPDDSLRDGAEAVRAAERALERGGTSVPEILDTVAAAYAEAGDFERAIHWATRATQLADAQGRQQLRSMLDANLERFRAGHPLREN